MAMATIPTGADVDAFLESIPGSVRRAEAKDLRRYFAEWTNADAVMWGDAIVGFGDTSYSNTTGEHPWFRVGFSPRASSLVIYGVDAAGEDDFLATLGPQRVGSSCLYVKTLARADLAALERIVRETAG